MSLLDNLVSYWKLDEASGDAIDAHGSHNLTDTNTVGATTGKVNGARDFERSNTEYFTVADNADLSAGDTDFTIAAWINLESSATSQINTIVSKWGASGNREYSFQSTHTRYFADLHNSSKTSLPMSDQDLISRLTAVLRDSAWNVVWEDVVQGLSSSSSEIRYLAFLVAFEGSTRVLAIDDLARAKACISFLTTAIQCDEGSEVLTRYEACEYMRVLFSRWWELRTKKGREICQIVRTEMEFCCKVSSTIAEVIVTVCLEHFFVEKGIRAYFHSWEHDAHLRQYYLNAISLADRWNTSQ